MESKFAKLGSIQTSLKQAIINMFINTIQENLIHTVALVKVPPWMRNPVTCANRDHEICLKEEGSSFGAINPVRFLGRFGYVLQERVYEEFVSAVTRHVSGVKVGHGLDPEVSMGPLITQDAMKKVYSMS